MANTQRFLPVLLGLALACTAIAPLGCAVTPRTVVVGGLRVPEGYQPKDGTTAEPYTNTGWAKEIVHEATGIELVFIPAGEFVMGESKEERREHYNSDSTLHPVRLTKPFYLGKYEVTQGQWKKVMGAKPVYLGKEMAGEWGSFKWRNVVEETEGDDRLPVEGVCWNVCHNFMKKAGGGLRFPTEAQWEYACRAGTTTKFNTGDTLSPTDANYYYSTAEHPGLYAKAMPVGSYKPNAWGLYDMHGNVSEWCWDQHGEFPKGLVVDPIGPKTWLGSFRVHRGGRYGASPEECSSGCRDYGDTWETGPWTGFRVALPVSP